MPNPSSDYQALSTALQRGDVKTAGPILRRLLKGEPTNPGLHHTAGELAWHAGNRAKALKHFGLALDTALARQASPQADAIIASASQQVGHLLGNYAINCQGLISKPVFIHLLLNSAIDPQAIATAAAPIWMDTPPWRRAFRLPADDAAAWLLSADGQAAKHDGLAAALFTRAVLSDPKVEALLLAIRTSLLGQESPDQNFLRMIAWQWHLRDYAAVVSVDEAAQLKALGQASTGNPMAGGAPNNNPINSLKRALYENPATGRADHNDTQDPWLHAVITQRQQEQALAKDLPSTGGDDTGDRVRAQYEQHPYPRWLGLTVPTPGSRRALIMRATGDTSWRDRSLQVLIAGCGTGRHALMAALGYGPRTNTLAVDVSRTSLGYAARMAETYKVKALGFAHGDLRDLTKLPPGCLPAKGFDVIESIGVLHHLPDTAEGLIALAEHLKPGGVIQLGLYRAGGRRHVALARAEIEDLGLDGTKDDDIRQYRAHVLARPDHEIFPALAHNRDFYSLAGCRDLLFHARERDIEMAKIAGLLEQAGLEFLTMQMPDGVRQAFIADHGEAALTDLGLWQSFEVSRPDLFDAMYRFWAIKPR